MGSPPRVRGKVPAPVPQPVPERITPARAGKRPGRPRPSGSLRDHPRACGEKVFMLLTAPQILGSPPRVRGKVNKPVEFPHKYGITPARAGKSLLPTQDSNTHRDHPRACGEKLNGRKPLYGVWGSPPRVRGKGAFDALKNRTKRITPARAGKRLNGSRF